MAIKPVKPSLLVKAEKKHAPRICMLPLTGGRPCLDFINTIDWRLDPIRYSDTLLEYSDLLSFSRRLGLIDAERERGLAEGARQSPQVAARALAAAQAFRDTLTAIIDDIAGGPGTPARAAPRDEALALFDSARHRAHASEVLTWRDGRMRLISRPESELLDLPWLTLVRDAEALLESDQVMRVRICAAPGCGWAFLDTSKNGTRRWCSMQLCGNREKARRFKKTT